ncbi:971_t:CDS:2 [Ambispora gerdemannii]|uniref:971_t:CDS:1 n=1 Tax=Ambispora gerdemannii TaxID=144530 RepID=A0A9N9ABN3_9GLOM|nr:971_t:CDS:2 [Ambispora gerdemannii]
MTSGEDSSTPSSLTSSIPDTPQTNATGTPNYQLPRKNDNTTQITPPTPTPTITSSQTSANPTDEKKDQFNSSMYQQQPEKHHLRRQCENKRDIIISQDQRIAQLRQQMVDVQKALISTQANLLVAKANSIKHTLSAAATVAAAVPAASGAAPTMFPASSATIKTTHQHHLHPQNYSNVQPPINQQQYYNNHPSHFVSSLFGNDGGNESEIKRGDGSNNIATALISNALASNKPLANNNFVDGVSNGSSNSLLDSLNAAFSMARINNEQQQQEDMMNQGINPTSTTITSTRKYSENHKKLYQRFPF